MALKATKITRDNQKELASKFDIVDGEEADELPLGFWLVTEFGNEHSFDVLTPTNFDLLFVIEQEIRNGFYAIQSR